MPRDEPVVRMPITGIAFCCAREAPPGNSGAAVIEPKRTRRLILKAYHATWPTQSLALHGVVHVGEVRSWPRLCENPIDGMILFLNGRGK